MSPAALDRGRRGPVAPRQPATGEIVRVEGAGDWGLSGYAYVPETGASGAPWLIATHGISRDAREQVEAFAPLAAAHRLVVLAPEFNARRFGDYQRLGRVGRGARADLALEELIRRLGERIASAPERLCLFGYSGGGQFVHRFVMAHPERVEAAVVAAPGWYTFPEPGRAYPRGLRVGADLPGVRMVPAAFLRVRMLVVVGTGDVERDESLRRTPRIDEGQGRTRVERAARWVQAMNAAARGLGLPECVRLELLPGSGHGFASSVETGLVRAVDSFLFSESIVTTDPRGG